jgi:predicted amidophosphoribosyltransferase
MTDVPQPPGAPRSGKPSTGEVTCPACGSTFPATKTFCGHCGARLARPCLACGAENPPGNTFCGDCGARLGVAAPHHMVPASDAAGTM